MGRKSKADVRKQEILGHFYAVMRDEGFENASIAKIAERMQVNPSLLIHYFKTKEEMVVDVAGFFLSRYEEAFLEEYNKINDLRLRFEKTLNILFSVEWLAVGDYSVFYSCYYLAARHPRIRERFQTMFERFREILSKEAQAWIDNKLITLNNPTHAAEYLIMLVEGMAFYQRIFSPEEYAERARFTRELAYKTLTC